MDIAISETPETGLSAKMMHSKLAMSLRNNGTLDSLKVIAQFSTGVKSSCFDRLIHH
jgi:hypothetical protein